MGLLPMFKTTTLVGQNDTYAMWEWEKATTLSSMDGANFGSFADDDPEL